MQMLMMNVIARYQQQLMSSAAINLNLIFMKLIGFFVIPPAGVQIAYYAIIFSQLFMMVLSLLLGIGIYTVSWLRRIFII